jgi:hypothetical protein
MSRIGPKADHGQEALSPGEASGGLHKRLSRERLRKLLSACAFPAAPQERWVSG